MKIENFLQNLRNFPESKKKNILWAIIIVVGVILLILWWFLIFQKSLAKLNKENLIKTFNIGELQEKIENVPKVEMPNISQEDLKKFEEEAKKLENQATRDVNLK